MESPEYLSSPEVGPKRSHNTRSPPLPSTAAAQDDRERPTHIRFLASNTAAGCIIGKGGSTITEFQSQSGARIQLSRNHENFPRTSDRTIMVSGSVDEILKAMELILEKLLSELQAEENTDADSRSKLRLIVPNSSCGGIIGKGGSTIKSFIEESQADIKISPQDQNNIGLNDRLVTLMGTLDEQMRAISLIVSKLAEDSHYPPTLSSPFQYAGVNFSGVSAGYVIPPVGYNSMNYGSNGIAGRYPNNKGSSSQGASKRSQSGVQENNSVTIGIADEHIGAVVGRGGRNIMEITQSCGARIKISDRGDFLPGTFDRKVTITGPSDAIRAAEAMIMQKVSSNSERK